MPWLHRSQPGVVCRSPAPPSAIFIMRGSGSVVEALAPSGGWPLGVALLCRLDRRRRDDAWRRRDWPLLSSRVPGRGNTPRACVRVSVEFVLEGADLGVDLRKKALEPVWATIAGGACGCPDPDALLRDRGRGHGAVGQEWRDSLRREPIQKVGTLDTKGWEGIEGSGRPRLRASGMRSARYTASRALAPSRCPRVSRTATAPPSRRIDRWPSRMSFDRVDARVGGAVSRPPRKSQRGAPDGRRQGGQ